METKIERVRKYLSLYPNDGSEVEADIGSKKVRKVDDWVASNNFG
jgi:hypothetical protein